MHWVCVAVGFAALLGAVAWGMDYARRSALATYQGPEAKADWEDWRKDAKQQAEGAGPVFRRVPKSTEPPALVMMRDYFWECLICAWAVTAAVAWSMYFFFRGMLRSPTWQPIEDPVHPALKKPAISDD